MSRLPIEVKEKGVRLRRQGHSLKEMSALLGIAKSTASYWSRDIILSESAKKKLLDKIKVGQYISAENKKARTRKLKDNLFEQARRTLATLKMKEVYGRLLCAMIYWCEGAKRDGGIAFTNSDPGLINKFIKLLVEYYGADRSRFKVRLHLHSYHNQNKQTLFWRKKLRLPSSCFYSPYLKPNSGKRLRDDYPGCAALTYGDTMLARELLALAKAFLNKK